MSKIIAIDPGTNKVGIAIFNKDKLLLSTNIRVPDVSNINERYRFVFIAVKDVLSKIDTPDVVVIETPFFMFSHSVAIKLGTVRGIIIAAVFEVFKDFSNITDMAPVETRCLLGLTSKAKKEDCHAIVKKRFKSIETKSEDELDAIAIGLASIIRNKNNAKKVCAKVPKRRRRGKKD